MTFTYKKNLILIPQCASVLSPSKSGEVIPELVPLDKDGNPEAVDYAKFVAVLTKAIQEQQVQIDALKSGGGFSVSSTLSAISDSLNATLAQIQELTVQTLRIETRSVLMTCVLVKKNLKHCLKMPAVRLRLLQ